MRSNPITDIFEMTSLCPHLFQEYLHRVTEILETYKPQILVLVKYEVVADGLLSHHVVKKREHAEILKNESEKEQMEKLILILEERMWGLENFISALIEKDVDTWLAEELFAAYVRHLVTKMKEIQTQNNICSCFHGGNNSPLYRSWLQALTTFDGWLNEIGGSLGFLTLTMRPVKSALNFISERLPITRKKIAMIDPAEAMSDSDSDDEGASLEPKSGAEDDLKTSEIHLNQNSVPLPQQLSIPRTDSSNTSTTDTKHMLPNQSPLQRCVSTPSLQSNSGTINSSIAKVHALLAKKKTDDPFDDSAWNGPKVVRPKVIPEAAEPETVASDPNDFEWEWEHEPVVFVKPNRSVPRTTSTVSTSTSTTFNDTGTDESDDDDLESLINKIAKIPDDVPLPEFPIVLTSVSTQTSCPPSPIFRERSHSLPENIPKRFGLDYLAPAPLDTKIGSFTLQPGSTKTGTGTHTGKSIKTKPMPAPENTKPSATMHRSTASHGLTKKAASITGAKSKVPNSTNSDHANVPANPNAYLTRASNFAIRKPSSLNQSNTSARLAAPKVATITPRQRVFDAIKAKKANATPPPPPVNEERLKPQDYRFQQWSNSWAARKHGEEHGGSVA